MSSSHNVAFVGDSWAEFGNGPVAFRQACPGVSVRQAARGATTASQWARGPLLEGFLDDLENDNFVPDYVWLSIGGNDLIFTLCATFVSVETVANNIRTVAERLEQEFPNLERILLTGYGIPPLPLGRNCARRVRSLYTDYDYTPKTTVVLIDELFGGVLTDTQYRPSDFSFYSDPIHLNRDGYDILFEYEPVAWALGCFQSDDNTENPVTLAPDTAPPSTSVPVSASPTTSYPTSTAPTVDTAVPTLRISSTGSPTNTKISTGPPTFAPTTPAPTASTAVPTAMISSTRSPTNTTVSTEPPTFFPASFSDPTGITPAPSMEASDARITLLPESLVPTSTISFLGDDSSSASRPGNTCFVPTLLFLLIFLLMGR